MLLWLIVNNQKHKKYFIYYIKENVLIFDVSRYIDELAVHVVDFVYDWSLFKDNLVNCSDKLIKELIQTKIQTELEEFLKVAKENNCKILSFLFLTNLEKNWQVFFKDHLKFIKICKRTCKKFLPNFTESKIDKLLFLKTKGKFLDFDCLIPSGDDEEFLLKALDKLKP